MRRFLPLSVLVLLVAAALFGAAMATRAATPDAGAKEQVASRVAAPITAPAAAPDRDRSSNGFIYGYRTSDELGAALDVAEGPATEEPLGAGQIRVTARVLPAVVVTLDDAGRISKLQANTDARDARSVMYVLPRALDAATWTELRSALAEASAGTGTIWVR